MKIALQIARVIIIALTVGYVGHSTQAQDIQRFDGAIRILPDPTMTPGANDPANVDPALTPAVLCADDFTTKAIRHVTDSMANQVYRNYQVEDHEGYCSDVPDGTKSLKGCEIDHLCSLELGCRNTVGNLWAQPYGGTVWNAHVKDKLENKAHRLMCQFPAMQRKLQVDISTNWIEAYKKYIGPAP